MQVFIMRHGEAEMMAASDSQRELTDSGRVQVERMAARVHEHLDSLDYVLVSPYMRAQQTWQLIEPQLSHVGKVITLDELIPSGDEIAVVDLIETLAEEEPQATLLVVSHLPLVGYLVDGLIPGAGAPIFSTAAIAQLHVGATRSLIGLTHPGY